jgi:accessory gene regulator protein AgrB
MLNALLQRYRPFTLRLHSCNWVVFAAVLFVIMFTLCCCDNYAASYMHYTYYWVLQYLTDCNIITQNYAGCYTKLHRVLHVTVTLRLGARTKL